jgi:serine kinase of HPr protein (carbohydrate metabolism regulator)
MKKRITLGDILLNHSTSLGIQEIASTEGLKSKVSKLHLKRYSRITYTTAKKEVPAIIILNPQLCERLCSQGYDDRRKFLNQWSPDACVCFIISQSDHIPLFLKKVAHHRSVSLVASSCNEHYLESLVQGAIREQLHQVVAIHGVAMEEAQGKGILITGASGVGKTTAALTCVQRGHFWIADDLALIKKDKDETLIVTGHRRIRHFLHIPEIGIIPVRKVLVENKIKATTKLAAVIEVIRSDSEPLSTAISLTNILGVDLPCCRLNISSSGYFTESLLEDALICIKGWYS